MRIFADLSSPEFSEAQRFVHNDLEKTMQDPEFRAGIALAGRAEVTVHKEMVVGRRMEQIGAYVKHGLLDAGVIYDVAWPMIVGNWRKMEPLIEIRRTEIFRVMWENFEFLYRECVLRRPLSSP